LLPNPAFGKSGTKRILVLIVGWSFILLGIVGLFLPILVLFILTGLIILSSDFPRLGRTADEASAKAAARLQRLSVNAKRAKWIDAEAGRC
jgi:uncharacterized membrane protein YbaN (DUF454 family)